MSLKFEKAPPKVLLSINREEHTNMSAQHAKSLRHHPVHRKLPAKFFRDGTKFICKFCGRTFVNRAAVEQCYDRDKQPKS